MQKWNTENTDEKKKTSINLIRIIDRNRIYIHYNEHNQNYEEIYDLTNE